MAMAVLAVQTHAMGPVTSDAAHQSCRPPFFLDLTKKKLFGTKKWKPVPVFFKKSKKNDPCCACLPACNAGQSPTAMSL